MSGLRDGEKAALSGFEDAKFPSYGGNDNGGNAALIGRGASRQISVSGAGGFHGVSVPVKPSQLLRVHPPRPPRQYAVAGNRKTI